MARRRFWVSWIQPTEDYRPLADPPNVAILGWWCTGYSADGWATLCAVVEAKSGTAAKSAVKVDWPEASVWRFCEKQDSDYVPGDRFPKTGWIKERLKCPDQPTNVS